MMKETKKERDLLWRQGTFEILSDDVGNLSPGKMNELIKRCGTVSHQSWKTSKKTGEEFIQMIFRQKPLKHLSVLEHSCFTFFIPADFDGEKRILKSGLLDGNHLFCITDRPDGFLISGNARMFIEAYLRNPTTTTATLLYYLKQRNPVLFPVPIKWQLVLPPTFVFSPSLKTKEEILVHRAMTVLFQHISRGFAHEDVRSRNGHNKIASYTQRSTRYVNPLKKGSFRFILPYRKNLPSMVRVRGNIGFTFGETLELYRDIYKGLTTNGLRPEEARQWLPIGIETEIAQTMNLAEWLHWFVIRTQKAAHPEIRFVACNLLKQMQKDIPGIFTGFEFREDKEDICYTVFTPPSSESEFLI